MLFLPPGPPPPHRATEAGACTALPGSTSLLTGLQQISASVSGSLTRVHSLVRKAGTLLGPAVPGPTGRSIPGKAERRKLRPQREAGAGLAPPPCLQGGPRRRRPLRTHSPRAQHGRRHLATGALTPAPPFCVQAARARRPRPGLSPRLRPGHRALAHSSFSFPTNQTAQGGPAAPSDPTDPALRPTRPSRCRKWLCRSAQERGGF